MKLANFSSKFRADLIIKTYSAWLDKKATVLDVGCGNGVVSEYIAKQLKIKLTGCDIENYLLRDIPFIQMRSQYILPFKNKQFDAVMLNDVLHHLPKNKQKVLLAECKRVAIKVLIFEVYPNLSGKLFDCLLNKIHNKNMSIPWSFRDINGWEKLFKKLKLKTESIKVTRSLLYPVQHIAFKLEK